jgi:apolipoprotein N-acyltransferase
MLTSTNTGITAAIDAKGRVVAQLAPQTSAVLPVLVQGRSGLSPYTRYGDQAILALIGLILLVAGVRRRK